MGIDRRQAWILGFLGVVLLVVWIRAFNVHPVHLHRAKGARAPTFQQPSKAPPAVPADSPTGSYAQEWGESPFLMDRDHRRTAGPISEMDPEQYLLEGILWDPQAPSAIVNNQVVNIGDRIGPWRVAEIQKDKVILSNGEDTKTLQTQ